jgi:hypothetical protein
MRCSSCARPRYLVTLPGRRKMEMQAPTPDFCRNEYPRKSTTPNDALERSEKGCGWHAAGAPEEFAPAARWPRVARPAQRGR